MGLLAVLVLGIFAWDVFGQSYWVDDPADCPDEYNSITCLPELVCGLSGESPLCYDTSSINPPASLESTWSNNIADFDGGFLLNCYATDASEPYCFPSSNDCDRNATCYSTQHRYTNCTAGLWGVSVCGDCYGNYRDCDADVGICEVLLGSTNCGGGANNNYASCTSCQCDGGWEDCDAGGVNETNGCEYEVNAVCNTNAKNLSSCAGCTCNANYFDCDDGDPETGGGCGTLNGGSCSVGGLSGTTSCTAGAGGCYAVSGGTEYACTCEVDAVDIGLSGDWLNWSSSLYPFLWLHQYGSAPVVNFTTLNNNSFYVKDSGVFWNGQDLTVSGVDTNETVRMDFIYDYHVSNRSLWDEAYSWGDHSLEGYLTSYTDTNETVKMNELYPWRVNYSLWDTAYSWGDHSSAGYVGSLDGYFNSCDNSSGCGYLTVESDPVFNAWDYSDLFNVSVATTVGADVNMSGHNITDVDCIVGVNGGSWCFI